MQKNNKKIVAVLGAGNMGTAVAYVLADNGHEVRLWNWEQDHKPLHEIIKYRENKTYLPKVKLSNNIIPVFHIEEALKDASVVFFVVSSGAMEHTISFAARSIHHRAVVVDVSKGVEPNSLQLIPNVITKHLRPSLKGNVVAISGPAVAKQMVEKHYTAMNIAGKRRSAIAKVREVLENDYIKLIPTNDMIGVELGGSFKNVYAIAVGMCDGLGYGLNTKAAILTYALRELAELIKSAGGKKETAYSLAGLGDLIGTAFAEESRNRQLGEYLGKGLTPAMAQKKVKQTVEGIGATKCLLQLAEKYNVDTSFAKIIYACLNAKGDSRKIFREFISSL